MKQIRDRLILCICLMLCNLLFADTVNKQNTYSNIPEVHLLIDISPSMKAADPDDLRIKATKMFIYLLKHKAKLFIQTFATNASELMPLQIVTDDYESKFTQKAMNITPDGSFANIDKALNAANQQWNSKDKIIIVLTNGRTDSSNEDLLNRSLFKISNQTLATLQKLGIRVFTIEFTPKDSNNALIELSAKTNGLSLTLAQSRDLDKILYKIFTAIIPVNSTELNSTSPSSKVIKVDDRIRELTLIFNKEKSNANIMLVAPDGKKQSILNLENKNFTSDNYLFVNIQQPALGDWRLEGPLDSLERVLLFTDIKLVSSFKSGTYFVNELFNVVAKLKEEGNYINLPQVFEQMTMKLRIMNSKHHYLFMIPFKGDGVFKSKIRFVRAGSYTAILTAQSPNLSREVANVIDVQDFPFKLTINRDATINAELVNLSLIKDGETKFKVFLNHTPITPVVSRYSGKWTVDLLTMCDHIHTTSSLSLRISTKTVSDRRVVFLQKLPNDFCPPPVLPSKLAPINTLITQHATEPVVKQTIETVLYEQKRITKALHIIAEQERLNVKAVLSTFILLLVILSAFIILFLFSLHYARKIKKIKHELVQLARKDE